MTVETTFNETDSMPAIVLTLNQEAAAILAFISVPYPLHLMISSSKCSSSAVLAKTT